MKLAAVVLALAPLPGLFQEDAATGAPELPEVRLPVSAHVGELDADAVVLSILPDGRVVVSSQEPRVLVDPAVDDEARAVAKLRGWLAEAAKGMDQAPPAEGWKTSLPDDPLLLRVDVVTPFWHVQRVMELCGNAQVRIWRVELAAATPEEHEASDIPAPFVATTARGAPLHAHLPLDLGLHEDGVETVEVSLRVVKEGRPVERDGELVQDEPRELEYRVGPRATADPSELAGRLRSLRAAGRREVLSIEAFPGVTHGEVVEVVDAALDAGFGRVLFVGRR